MTADHTDQPTEMPEHAFRASQPYRSLAQHAAERRASEIAALRDGAVAAAASMAAGRPSANELKAALASTTGGLRLAINLAGIAVGAAFAFMALKWGGLL